MLPLSSLLSAALLAALVVGVIRVLVEKWLHVFVGAVRVGGEHGMVSLANVAFYVLCFEAAHPLRNVRGPVDAWSMHEWPERQRYFILRIERLSLHLFSRRAVLPVLNRFGWLPQAYMSICPSRRQQCSRNKH